MSTRNPDSFAARWFSLGVHFFAVGMVGALAAIALGPLPQIQALGGIAMSFAIVGTLVCLLGLRTYDQARWRRLRDHATSVGDSWQGAREAIGEPRQLAYARTSAAQRRGVPRVVWPV